MNKRRWCEFVTKGSKGNVSRWHAVFRHAGEYRSLCGRLFTTAPTITSDTKPNDIRAICNRCEQIAGKAHPDQRP